MKILILVHSCYKNLHKIQSVLDTWYKDIKEPHKMFICGDIDLYKHYGSDIVWLCASGANGGRGKLPIRSLNMMRMALADNSWDFLYKCDDDTYLNIDVLEKELSKIDSTEKIYIGTPIKFPYLYAQGGAGYVLSRSAIIQAWDKFEEILPKENAEDRGIGKAFIDSDIEMIVHKKFNTGIPKNKADEDKRGQYAKEIILSGSISSHYVEPEYMHKIYEAIHEKF